MNLLIGRLLADLGPVGVRAGAVRLGLPEVVDAVGLQLPEPGSQAEAEVFERAQIPLRDRVRWYELAGRIPTLPDQVTMHSWTAAVPLPDVPKLAFVPDDDRPDPQVLIFSQLANRRGRLRLSMAGGPIGPISGITFEASLHCDDMTCIDDDGCGECCDGCACRQLRDGLVIKLRCWCPIHGCA